MDFAEVVKSWFFHLFVGLTECVMNEEIPKGACYDCQR